MAKKTWIANAQDITQIDTITIGGTWLQNDTITLTINGKELVITIGTLVTTAQVATTVAEAYGGNALTDPDASYTPTGGGPAIEEFNEQSAAASASTVVLTAITAGVPIENAVAKVSTSGTVGLANTVVATGKHWFDNVDNWDTGSVPVTSDELFFVPEHPIDCLYGLDQGGVTPARVSIQQGYTGQIGLPERNTNFGDDGFDEYRDTYLRLGEASDAVTIKLEIGNGQGAGPVVKIDFDDCPIDAVIYNSGSSAEGVPGVLLEGTSSSNLLRMEGGSVGMGFKAGNSQNKIGVIQNGGSLVLLRETELQNLDKSGGDINLDLAQVAASCELSIR